MGAEGEPGIAPFKPLVITVDKSGISVARSTRVRGPACVATDLPRPLVIISKV